MASSELTIVQGGKLLAAYEGRKLPTPESDKISAVGAHIMQRLGLCSRGYLATESLEQEVAVPKIAEIECYDPNILRRTVALLNRNPNNDEDCRSMNEEFGFTMLLTARYPLNHSEWGWERGAPRGLGNLMLYDYLLKPYDRSRGTWLIRFPLGRYAYDENESTFPNIAVYPNFVIDTEGEDYQQSRFPDGDSDRLLFLKTDYEQEFCTSRIPLARNWVARIEGDQGSLWQNPQFSTVGLPIKQKHWPR